MDAASTGRAAHILGRRRFLAIAAGAAAVAIPRSAQAERPIRGGVLKHIGLEPQTFDIHATTSYATHLVSSFARRTLFKFVNGARYGPADFTIVPDLALRAGVSADGKIYTIRLRPGAPSLSRSARRCTPVRSAGTSRSRDGSRGMSAPTMIEDSVGGARVLVSRTSR